MWNEIAQDLAVSLKDKYPEFVITVHGVYLFVSKTPLFPRVQVNFADDITVTYEWGGMGDNVDYTDFVIGFENPNFKQVIEDIIERTLGDGKRQGKRQEQV